MFVPDLIWREDEHASTVAVTVWNMAELERLRAVCESRWRIVEHAYQQFLDIKAEGDDMCADAARGLLGDRVADYLEAAWAEQQYKREGDRA